ncbi:MAG: hypothetical protein EOM91_22195 [Sphingobacteriia bacterium]|nr:hypothetical protein [Sphingobacteriia bacterium]
MNRATGPYSAIVGGKPTALAGCPRTDCPHGCLRKDAMLAKAERQGYQYIDRQWSPIDWRTCSTFIPAEVI